MLTWSSKEIGNALDLVFNFTKHEFSKLSVLKIDRIGSTIC